MGETNIKKLIEMFMLWEQNKTVNSKERLDEYFKYQNSNKARPA